MPGDRLSVAVVAELREFERKLGMMPEIGGVEAKKLASQIRKELKTAEDGAKDSASKIGRALGGVGDVVEKGLKKLGPLGGEVADVLFDFGGPLAEAALGVGEVTSGLGAAGMAATVAGGAVLGIGAALAVAVVGAGLLVAGATAVTEAAIAATDRLDAMGMAARVPEESREALERYQGATARLWAEVDVLTTQLGAALAPALTVVADLVGDAIEWVTRLDKSFDALQASIDNVLDMLPDWAEWVPAVRLVRGAVDALESSYDALVETAQSADLAPTAEQIDAWHKAADEKRRIASEDAARQRDELIASIELELDYNARIAELQQWLVDHERELDEAQWARKVEAYNEEVAAHERAQDLMLAATIASQNEQNKAHKKTRDEAQKNAETAIDSIDKILDATQDLTDFVVDSYQRRADAGEELNEAERRAANTAFRIGQAAALAQIGIHLAVAFAGFVAAYSASGPFALLGATAEVAAAAAAIAPILGQTPPFPMGESPNLVGESPQRSDPVEDRGTREGYADAYGAGNVSSGGGRDRSSRMMVGGGEVALTFVFRDGRVGKRRVI